MSELQMPYQCLKKHGDVLVAARGSTIDLFSLVDQSLLSTWTCPPDAESKISPATGVSSTVASQKSDANVAGDASTPPAKRRKLSNAGEAQQSHEKKGEMKSNNRSDTVAGGLRAPAIIALAATNRGYVIAVTGEDKSIRVFEDVSDPNGGHQLKQISRRTMPKRPCALTITDDGLTIITADKFGDVYSLPLLIPDRIGDAQPISGTRDPRNGEGRPFTPAASDLTVHSQRNLKALQNQKKQTNTPSEKSGPTFEHELLLGHVSMLTDVALTSLGGRNYIITADRDEHIRISRGIPQAHIVEGFCLGHTEFVSRLCIPVMKPEILISGGGDGELYVWQWATGDIISKSDLRGPMEVARSAFNGQPKDEGLHETKIAVSGITHIGLISEENAVVVICEGSPFLFLYFLTSHNTLDFVQSIQLEGNALSVMTYSHNGSDFLIVSVDWFHKPGSTTERRDEKNTTIRSLLFYEFHDRHLTRKSLIETLDHRGEYVDGNGTGRLSNLLYNLENLRKRDGGEED